eukprot:CAMPEP_0118639612 /NCGR_PEP_ID=MMETSP0785-20121206/4313_1 /TAXON_ID=91992 /ORGANISM="Bolidomonas pacifica, Strain CCMP 1866" /LENGTH=456 /DNA_ID=CAMNT_0006530945 /DNA_START=112 /DNA_END=1479 /DNA_ORIENTATION=-
MTSMMTRDNFVDLMSSDSESDLEIIDDPRSKSTLEEPADDIDDNIDEDIDDDIEVQIVAVRDEGRDSKRVMDETEKKKRKIFDDEDDDSNSTNSSSGVSSSICDDSDDRDVENHPLPSKQTNNRNSDAGDDSNNTKNVGNENNESCDAGDDSDDADNDCDTFDKPVPLTASTRKRGRPKGSKNKKPPKEKNNAPTPRTSDTPPNPLSVLNSNRRKKESSKKKFLSTKRGDTSAPMSEPSPGGQWVRDEDLGGEIFVPDFQSDYSHEKVKKKKTTIKPPVKHHFSSSTTTNSSSTSSSDYPPFNPNYTTWVPPIHVDRGPWTQRSKKPTGQYDYSMQFNSFEDAASEQERLLSESKKRVEARKEREKQQASQKQTFHQAHYANEVSFNYPCNLNSFSGSSSSSAGTFGPPLPNDHYLFKSPFGRLGLPENSSLNLIRKHYKKLALIYHPDKYKGTDK